MDLKCACGRPIHDQALVCRACWTKVEQSIGETMAVLAELETTRTRQARTGGNNGGRKSAETPMVWLEAASKADKHLRETVTTWAQFIADELVISVDYHNRPDTATSLLLTRSTWLRHHEAAPQAQASLTGAVRAAWSVIDLGPDLLYAGPCDPSGEFHTDPDELQGPCTMDLYARADKAEVTCPRCQLVWRVQGRRDYLLASAEEQLVTAADLSRFLSAYGEPLTNERIRQWASRGQLVNHGHNPAGSPLYKVGEAISVLARMNEKTERRAS